MLRIVGLIIVAATITTGATLFAEPPDQPKGAAGQRDRAEQFKMLDVDSNGTVTEDEVPQEERRLFDRLIRRADENGDHQLTQQEFQMVQGERRGPKDGGPEGRERDRGDRPNPPPGGRMGPLMRTLDADHDGKLSTAEIADAAAALKKLDQNGDGELTREELLPPGAAGFMGREGERGEFGPEAMVKRFMERDKNGDGRLQKDELADRMQERFDRLDANSDGALDETELKQGFDRLRGPEGNRPGRPGRPDRPGDGDRPDRPDRQPGPDREKDNKA